MIVRIEGIVVAHDGNSVVVDCRGVGYGVTVPIDEQAALPIGKETILWISEHIKEDMYELFGFTSTSRRGLFRQLLSVNGVGPKAAMSLLSLGNETEVRSAIASGDVKYLSSASGVGKKVAERVIVDLKSKVGLGANADATNFLYESETEQDDAVLALVSLGYSSNDAKAALSKIDPTLSLEQRVASVLRGA